jgi:hypothetical protein
VLEPRLLPLERVGPLPPDLTAISGGRGGIDAQGAIGATKESFGVRCHDEDLPGVRGDGLDAARDSCRELDDIVSAVHHGQRARSGGGQPHGDGVMPDSRGCWGWRRESQDSEPLCQFACSEFLYKLIFSIRF